MSADRYLQRVWYGEQRTVALLLVPLSWLFRFVVALRRLAYRIGLLRSHRVARPVIVIGNITVGGTGKTPFTSWLAEQLERRGVRVGIVLRGYGGSSREWPRHVTNATPWSEVGDEAALYARSTSAIVVAGPDRVADARLAISLGAQIVLSDDGLQHYRLRRDAEILVIDAQRGIGNARLLPAGPLREPRGRMTNVDLQVVTRRFAGRTEAVAYGTSMAIVATASLSHARSLISDEAQELSAFTARPVHAVAAIGHPEAFFQVLRSFGLDVREHAYPDHAVFRREQIAFADGLPVLMTEKDAVKCIDIADERHWAVPLRLQVSDADVAIVSKLLDRVLSNAK
jgi:tetraacyldisaccharide 4'-kinase